MKDPGFHRCEMIFRKNCAPGDNDPDAILIDHSTGFMIRLPVDHLAKIASSITVFLQELEDGT